MSSYQSKNIEIEYQSSQSLNTIKSRDIEIENKSSNISEEAQNAKPQNTSKNNSKLLIISVFVFLTILAFALGFGSSIAFLIHRGEYNSFDDYMNSIKKSKESDQNINNLPNQNIQINEDIQKQSNEPPNEENYQKTEMQ